MCKKTAGFIRDWAEYLSGKGHKVSKPAGMADILLSKNGRGVRYRWLLVTAQGSAHRLTAIDHENIQRQLQLGRRKRERVYLVVRFCRPQAKVVAIPAARAVKMRAVRCDPGGIPWQD